MILKRVMFVGAHPDDVEMNAGGTIRKIVDQGGYVSVGCLSGSPARRSESWEANRLLGTSDLWFADGQDTRLGDDLARLIGIVGVKIAQTAPDTVITHFHADTHQDHVAAYKVAVASSRKVKNFLMFKPTYPSGRPDIPFHPTVISLLSQSQIRAKTDAINCFVSQREKYGDDRWAQAMEAVATGDAWTYAGHHGLAEVFQAGRLILT